MTEATRARAAAAGCRLLGLGWLALWLCVLWTVHDPWRHLGGLVAERLRWLEMFALALGAVVGFAIAGFVRDVSPPETARAYARSTRWLLYPPAVVAAVVLVGLWWFGKPDAAGILFTGWLAHWAGHDAAMGAVPLLHGRSPIAIVSENTPIPGQKPEDPR